MLPRRCATPRRVPGTLIALGLIILLPFAGWSDERSRSAARQPKGPPKPAEAPKGKEVPASVQLPAAWLQPLTWRCIGPANMGGRITALSVYEADPFTYFVATASGGLLKTVNNGTTFEHLFDKEATVSLGDVCVAPSNRNI